jgi:hypothetical protein
MSQAAWERRRSCEESSNKNTPITLPKKCEASMMGRLRTAETSRSRIPLSGIAFENSSTAPLMKLQPASTVGAAGVNQPARSCETRLIRRRA